jgi:hypothetical protein
MKRTVGARAIETNIRLKRSKIFPREQNFSSKMRQPAFSELRNFANRAEKFYLGEEI